MEKEKLFLSSISNTATIESLKEYEKTILELQQTYNQTLNSMLEAAKNYQNKAKDNNPYAQALYDVLKTTSFLWNRAFA